MIASVAACIKVPPVTGPDLLHLTSLRLDAPAGDEDRSGGAGRLTMGPVALADVRRYLTNVRTSISSKGQIVLPAEIRRLDRIEPGEEFEIERVEAGSYRLVRKAPPNEGVIDWLLACPEKGFFAPVASESTDLL